MTQPSSTWAVIAGGGTAGHVIPGVSIAREMVARGAPPEAVHYVGSERGIEKSLVPEARNHADGPARPRHPATAHAREYRCRLRSAEGDGERISFGPPPAPRRCGRVGWVRIGSLWGGCGVAESAARFG